MSRKVAIKAAKGAVEICSKRWPRAEVRLADDVSNEMSSFIDIGYTSKVPSRDIDMEAWAAHGAVLKREIHDYLLIRACEEVGVRPPRFERPKGVSAMEQLFTRWNAGDVTDEYHQLAKRTAWHAAFLTGLRYFDRILKPMSVSKARRAKFKKAFSASLERYMAGIPEMESNGRKVVDELGIELSRAVTSEGDDMAEDAIRTCAMIAFLNSVDSFVRTYLMVLY